MTVIVILKNIVTALLDMQDSVYISDSGNFYAVARICQRSLVRDKIL